MARITFIEPKHQGVTFNSSYQIRGNIGQLSAVSSATRLSDTQIEQADRMARIYLELSQKVTTTENQEYHRWMRINGYQAPINESKETERAAFSAVNNENNCNGISFYEKIGDLNIFKLAQGHRLVLESIQDNDLVLSSSHSLCSGVFLRGCLDGVPTFITGHIKPLIGPFELYDFFKSLGELKLTELEGLLILEPSLFFEFSFFGTHYVSEDEFIEKITNHLPQLNMLVIPSENIPSDERGFLMGRTALVSTSGIQIINYSRPRDGEVKWYRGIHHFYLWE